MRPFLQHALLPRFHRIRYRGYLHARGKSALDWLRLILDAKLQPQVETSPREPTCPRCGGEMLRVRRMPRAPPCQRNEHFFLSVAA